MVEGTFYEGIQEKSGVRTRYSEKVMKRDVDVALKTQLDLRGGRRHG